MDLLQVQNLEGFNELNLNELETIDGGVISFTAGALLALGCFAIGTAAGLIWG